jgi:hypothetical protein
LGTYSIIWARVGQQRSQPLIEIRYSNQGEVDLSGTQAELQAIADTICDMLASDSGYVKINANTNYAPAPYDITIPILCVRRGIGPTKVSLSNEELMVEGSPENLSGFTSFLKFPPNAQPSEHSHYEYWTGNEWISPESIPLIIGIRQQSEKSVGETDE